jgi:hypothetical protein
LGAWGREKGVITDGSDGEFGLLNNGLRNRVGEQCTNSF